MKHENEKAYKDWYNEVSDVVKEPSVIYLSLKDLDNPDKHFSYADYLKLPETNRIMELIDGVMSLFSAPTSLHAKITTDLVTEFNWFIKQQKDKCRVFHNPFDVRLPLDGATEDDKIFTVVQPDICIICNASKIDKKGCLGAPDLIVEVLSLSNRKRDLVTKFNLYEAVSVKEYWIIDPKKESAVVFLLQKNGKYNKGNHYKCDEKIPVHILQGLEIDLRELFEE